MMRTMRTPILVALGFAVWATVVATGGAAAQDRADAGNDLPPGPGKDILQRACRGCHDLGEVTKFKGYWDRKQWREAIDTMIAYGAKVDQPDASVLTDYLVQHLGRK
jgi:cytochrome c5